MDKYCGTLKSSHHKIATTRRNQQGATATLLTSLDYLIYEESLLLSCPQQLKKTQIITEAWEKEIRAVKPKQMLIPGIKLMFTKEMSHLGQL